MSKTPQNEDCIALDEPHAIDHISDLSVGDRVLTDGRSQPLTVVDIGIRTIQDSRTDTEELRTPVAKLRGDWQNAIEIVIGHQLTRWDHGEDGIETVLRERETIVEMEAGRPVELQRTHVAQQAVGEHTDGTGDAQTVACDGGRSQTDKETEFHVPDDDAVVMTDGGTEPVCASGPPTRVGRSGTRRVLLVDSDEPTVDRAVTPGGEVQTT